MAAIMTNTEHLRFVSKFNRGPTAECWNWGGGRFSTGYGAFYLHGQNLGAHRVSLALHLKVALDDIGVACHTCDNPPCVNPHHLFNGSFRDNLLDAISKGRYRSYYLGRDHCSRGHAYLSGGYWIRARGTKQSRVCKECDRLRGIKHRTKRGQNVGT